MTKLASDELADRLQHFVIFAADHPNDAARMAADEQFIKDLREILIEIGNYKVREAHLIDALNYAYSEGFEWPVDPLPRELFGYGSSSKAVRVVL
jgi:hypothetical protein